MVIDNEKIHNFISIIKENIEKLGQLHAMGEKQFLEDFRNYNSAIRLLQITIESIINIANHIISRKSFRPPKDFADSFTILHEHQYVDESLMNKLRRMAKFRNRLVHVYWDIDYREIYKIIEKDLVDIDNFVHVIYKKLI